MRAVVVALLFGAAGACTRARPHAEPGSANAPKVSSASSASAAPSVSAAPSASASSAPSIEPRLVVHLVPLGDVSLETLEVASRGLRAHGPIAPVIEARRPLPAAAKTSEKGRFSAHALLVDLEAVPAAPGEKVLGVADVDIVAPKNGVAHWGLLGLGSLDDKTCVLSTFRMRREWENGGVPEALVRERLWKVALHEVGHTIGLPHCPEVACLMRDGHGTVKTVDDEHELCDACKARFTAVLARP